MRAGRSWRRATHQCGQLRRQARAVPFQTARDHAMTALILTLRGPAGSDLDLSAVTPDRLAGVDIKAVALPSGQRLGEPFEVIGDDAQNLFIRASGERLTH